MAFHPPSASSSGAGPSQAYQQTSSANYGEQRGARQKFDILEWYPHFQSCHRYFLDHAQHTTGVQALAAFINIQLPYQKHPFPVTSSATASPSSAGPAAMRQAPNPFSNASERAHAQGISLIPYLRRLIATGNDAPGVLHGFFGDAWAHGIGPLHEIERRNYLFAAKSTDWMATKRAYDISPEETVPFLSPLQGATEEELVAADSSWSDWISMQDWMLGPRALDAEGELPRMVDAQRVKHERGG